MGGLASNFALLRTHIEKIVNFTKAIALLNQKQRLHVQIEELEYIVAEPSDFLKALEILHASIMETISRIEKRQEETLNLFANSDVLLNKNDVASKLKVSTKTAQRALRTLASAGYLRDEKQGKTSNYQLMQKEPKHLDLLKNIRSFSLFHQNSLRNWLNTIWTTGHAKGTPIHFKHAKGDNGTFESDSAEQTLQHYALLSPLDTSTCPDVHMPSTPNSGLENQNEPNYLDKTERSINDDAKAENNQKSALKNLDDFVSVHWSEEGFGWHQCGICGYTKLTCCQGETFKKETVWLCEDCQTEWENRRTPS